MHNTSGRWKLGLTLALTTSLMWGALPIALKGLLQDLDSVTITWSRFIFAFIILGVFLIYKKRLPSKKNLNKKYVLALLFVAILGLLANYILYMVGLEYSTPESAQLMIQVAPMLLLIGGIVIFKESFNKWQAFGFFGFVLGLVLFFNHRLVELSSLDNDYGFGIFLIFIAALNWAAYALVQKQLLKHLSSEQVMFIIFVFGSMLFLPNSTPFEILKLDGLGWALLIFCGINTLIAYGAFAESLVHMEASRVSAVLAITPLFTLCFMHLTHFYFPDYIETENLNSLSIIGAILVVVGSAGVALIRSKEK